MNLECFSGSDQQRTAGVGRGFMGARVSGVGGKLGDAGGQTRVELREVPQTRGIRQGRSSAGPKYGATRVALLCRVQPSSSDRPGPCIGGGGEGEQEEERRDGKCSAEISLPASDRYSSLALLGATRYTRPACRDVRKQGLVPGFCFACTVAESAKREDACGEMLRIERGSLNASVAEA